jgi:hypothetical protein
MNKNLFLKPDSFYQRNIDPLEQYISQTAFYLSKFSSNTLEHCRNVVIAQLKVTGGSFKDPTVTYYERGSNGDRGEMTSSLRNYISTVKSENLILAPTLTCYIHPSEKQSILVAFTDGNTKARSIAKKEAFKAQSDGNMALFHIKNNEQTNKKLYNNSLSGGFVSKGCILNNPSAHSTLTSTTRSVTSICNATNEKLIGGNRHYHNPDITLYNIISIVSSLDVDYLSAVMSDFGIRCPSVSETMDCIRYSSDLYWRDEIGLNILFNFVEKLTPVERAGFVYIGDFYHLRIFNEDAIRGFITKLAMKPLGVVVPNALDLISKADEQLLNFVHLICMKEMKGRGKRHDELSEVDLNIVAACVVNVSAVLEEHMRFIDAFFLTTNVPGSSAYIRNMVRRVVVISDTDSSMFSVDNWVSWYFGSIIFSDESFAVAGAVMFMTTSVIAHILSIFSANMNVVKEKLHVLAMKPEFVFPVVATTPLSKHYFASIAVKEGNVYSKPSLEIKGVHLKNSALPHEVIEAARSTMSGILDKVSSNVKISITDELKLLAVLEYKIVESLHRGDVNYYKTTSIKLPEAYVKSPQQSPYIHVMFWNSVFKDKYGEIESPPFKCVKIPTIITNITGVNRWLELIDDKALAGRLEKWLKQYNKKALPLIYLPKDYVKAYGVPEEIRLIMDSKRVILELTKAQRIVVDTLGFCMKNEWTATELGYAATD